VGTKCLKFLLEKGKQFPNQICNEVDKSTPLHFAILSKNTQSAKILLSNGANPNVRDSGGNTPSHFAV